MKRPTAEANMKAQLGPARATYRVAAHPRWDRHSTTVCYAETPEAALAHYQREHATALRRGYVPKAAKGYGHTYFDAKGRPVVLLFADPPAAIAPAWVAERLAEIVASHKKDA